MLPPCGHETPSISPSLRGSEPRLWPTGARRALVLPCDSLMSVAVKAPARCAKQQRLVIWFEGQAPPMSTCAPFAPLRQAGCGPLHCPRSASGLERLPDDLVQSVRLEKWLQVFNARFAVGSE